VTFSHTAKSCCKASGTVVKPV